MTRWPEKERAKVLELGLGAREAFMQFVAHKAANQQRDEGVDRGVVERGYHPGEAFVHFAGVEQVGELVMDLVGDVLWVCADLGTTRATFKRCRTGHACTVVPGNSICVAGS